MSQTAFPFPDNALRFGTIAVLELLPGGREEPRVRIRLLEEPMSPSLTDIGWTSRPLPLSELSARLKERGVLQL